VTPSRSPVRTSQPSLPGRAKPSTAGETPALQVLDAIAREKQLKGWRQSKKIAVIQSRNPHWQDWAEKWGWQMAFAGVDQRTMSCAGNASTGRRSYTEVWGASTPFGCRLTSLSMTEGKELHCWLSTRDRQPSFSYLIRRDCVRKNAGEPKLSPLLGRDSKISSQVSGVTPPLNRVPKSEAWTESSEARAQSLEPRACSTPSSSPRAPQIQFSAAMTSTQTP
jgi:hypothetical protein